MTNGRALIVCFDTNILLYRFDLDSPDKRAIAGRIVDYVLRRGTPLPAQIASEFLAVVHRKRLLPPSSARETIARIQRCCPLALVKIEDLIAASELAETFQVQYFDALICVVSRRLGAHVLFSEDMHDGLRIDGVTLINPFNPTNAGALAELLDAPPQG